MQEIPPAPELTPRPGLAGKPAGRFAAKFAFTVCRFVLAVVVSVFFARWWCGRGAEAVMKGDLSSQTAMAEGAAHWIAAESPSGAFSTGSDVFDGEWLFGTYVMSSLGLVQSAWEHPELRERNAPLVREAVAKILSRGVKSFDARSWGEDPIDSLPAGRGDHAAYLGYLNLVLACQHLIDPASPTAALHESISQVLATRLEASPIGLLQTYPGECYPLDNAAGIASLALRDRSAARPVSPSVLRWMEAFSSRWRDPKTGLLIQAVDWKSGRPVDHARGSGTSLAAYFFSFADAALSRRLHEAAVAELSRSFCGFTAMREYPSGIDGRGDIDSGPLLAGLSISSTGFSLAGCRQQGDAAGFTARWRLVHLMGVPARKDGASHFIVGGRLGDAILFAMSTAVPASVLDRELPTRP